MVANRAGNTMSGVRKASVFAWVLGAATGLGAAEAPDVEYKPLNVGGLQEFGQIKKGYLIPFLNPAGTKITDEWVDHFGSFITQEALVDKRLRLQIGLGGIFEFPKEERTSEVFGGSQSKMFFIGPTIAKGTVLFGDPENPVFSIGGGLFPYKYNPDASDLGEYLFRSAPYPTYMLNGGVLAIGDNSAYLEGFQANLHLGGLSLDLIFNSETGMPPLYDWSLSGIATYKIADGLLELGGAVKLGHLIPIQRYRTRPMTKENAYFTGPDGIEYAGNRQYYANYANFYGAKGDTINAVIWQSKADSLDAWYVDSLKAFRGQGYTGPGDSTHFNINYYTAAGTTVMGRMALDLKRFVPGLRFFTEVAVLGLENYPIYYEKQSDRMPIMFGVNLPTFGLLDLLTIQGERFKSPYLNNTVTTNDRATPYFPDGTNPLFSQDEYYDFTKKDDWAWSVLLRRSFWSTFSISAQFARDHFRTVGTKWFYGPVSAPIDATAKNSDWYWMVQLAWGL